MMEKSVFKLIEERIGIPFVEEEFEKGTVCFATDPELRTDFRIQFTHDDIVNYVYGIVALDSNKNLASISSLKIPYPLDSDSFWQKSSIGKKYRESHAIKEIETVAVSKLNWESI